MQIVVYISIILLFVILFIIVKNHHEGAHITISQHAAKKKWTYVLFGLALTLIGGFFLVYLQTSLFPLIGMPSIFYLIVALSWIFLLLTAWVPDTRQGKKSKIHEKAALGTAVSMTLIIFSLIFATHLASLLKITAGITTLWYVFTLFLLFFDKKSLQYFLVYQVINIITFFLVLFAASAFH